MRYAVHNIAVELFGNELGDLWHTVIPFGKNAQLALSGGPDPAVLQEHGVHFATQYLGAEKTYLHIQTVCYCGQALPIERTSGEIEALLHLDSNHLQNQGLVIHSPAPQPDRLEPSIMERFDRWTALLEGEQFARVRTEIAEYLISRAGDRNFNRRRFIYFLNSYAGMLVGYAERHHFPLNQLTAEPSDAACFERSDQSLEEMQAWVDRSLRLLEQEGALRSQDPVTATKVFIEEHLADELDVTQIAENVHLNQDYLTRIFKRETGSSVKGYVVARRMEKARELLETSKLPITDVAYQVGYYNYTSFNRVFKKTFGTSPQGYRKQSQ